MVGPEVMTMYTGQLIDNLIADVEVAEVTAIPQMLASRRPALELSFASALQQEYTRLKVAEVA